MLESRPLVRMPRICAGTCFLLRKCDGDEHHNHQMQALSLEGYAMLQLRCSFNLRLWSFPYSWNNYCTLYYGIK